MEANQPPFWQLKSRPFLLRQRQVWPGASRAFIAVQFSQSSSGFPALCVSRERLIGTRGSLFNRHKVDRPESNDSRR